MAIGSFLGQLASTLVVNIKINFNIHNNTIITKCNKIYVNQVGISHMVHIFAETTTIYKYFLNGNKK